MATVSGRLWSGWRQMAAAVGSGGARSRKCSGDAAPGCVVLQEADIGLIQARQNLMQAPLHNGCCGQLSTAGTSKDHIS